jgi:hypothetical protein
MADQSPDDMTGAEPVLQARPSTDVQDDPMGDDDRRLAIEAMLRSGSYHDEVALDRWSRTPEASAVLREWLQSRRRPMQDEFFAVDFDEEDRVERHADEISRLHGAREQ